jgi:hypothetical protein
LFPYAACLAEKQKIPIDEFGSSDSSLKENFPNGRKIKGDESSSQKSKLSNSEEKRLKSKVEELFGLPLDLFFLSSEYLDLDFSF